MFDDIPLREATGANAAADENRRIRRLRAIVDLTTNVLRQNHSLSEREARSLVSATRANALRLFPGCEAIFDLILAPRFERILRERGLVG